MGWSITLGRVQGIAVKLHMTFFLLLAWIGIGHFLAGGAPAAFRGLAFIGVIFGSVLLHEFGHALAAKRYGIRTPDITLLPIGGVARLERMPEEPRQELVVALAGPAVNILIAAGLFVVLAATNQLQALGGFALLQGNLLAQLLYINLWLVLFNLIPAFPMDGGRVLRAVLAERMSFARATQIAAHVGQGFAFFFVLLGFFVNPFLIFIGLFVYLGATGELTTARLRDFAQCVPVASVMLTDFRSLQEDAPLSDAVTALLRGTQREFPVVDGEGKTQGMLCREDMVRALSEHGPSTRICDVMQDDVPTVSHADMLDRVFQTMMSGQYTALPVEDQTGRLVGILTREHVGEVMMLESALERGGGARWKVGEGNT